MEKNSQSIKEIYEEIKKNFLLSHTKNAKDFTLPTDAISWEFYHKKIYLLAFTVKNLGQGKKQYTTFEREIIALYLSLNHFKRIRFNIKWRANTDNKILAFTPEKSSKRGENLKYYYYCELR
ncbi:hypothetical protein HZS_7795 [Henneguya salminicola]|nr:hypothetical protein HZS_7795 [Henneguya salminicola]